MALLFSLENTTRWIFPWPYPENSLTSDTGEAPNFLVKIWSDSFLWCFQLYTKDNTFRPMTIAHNGWVQWCIAEDYLKPAGLRWSKASLTTIHWPLSIDQSLSFFPVSLYHSNPIHLSALFLLTQSNEVVARLLQDSGRPQLNVFNQLLSPHLMGFLVPKCI